MHGPNTLQQLLGEALVVLVRKRLLALDDAVQIAVHQLHVHIQLGFLFK